MKSLKQPTKRMTDKEREEFHQAVIKLKKDLNKVKLELSKKGE